MKCAAAVIESVRGSALRASKVAVNQAGTTGLNHEATTVSPLRSSTCAFVTAVPHGASGMSSGDADDRTHGPPCALSQRRPPLTTAFQPARIVYATRSP